MALKYLHIFLYNIFMKVIHMCQTCSLSKHRTLSCVYGFSLYICNNKPAIINKRVCYCTAVCCEGSTALYIEVTCDVLARYKNTLRYISEDSTLFYSPLDLNEFDLAVSPNLQPKGHPAEPRGHMVVHHSH
jgi:hypothetical protein